MNKIILIITIISLSSLMIFTSYISMAGVGVSTPKIVKKSARVGSARRHHYIHGGYHHGK